LLFVIINNNTYTSELNSTYSFVRSTSDDAKNIFCIKKNCSTATSLRNQFYSILWCVVLSISIYFSYVAFLVYLCACLCLNEEYCEEERRKNLLLCVSLCQSGLFEFVILFFYIFYYSFSVLLVFNEALFFSSIIHRMQEHLSRTYPWILNSKLSSLPVLTTRLLLFNQ